jgi:hypothetical protein
MGVSRCFVIRLGDNMAGETHLHIFLTKESRYKYIYTWRIAHALLTLSMAARPVYRRSSMASSAAPLADAPICFCSRRSHSTRRMRAE